MNVRFNYKEDVIIGTPTFHKSIRTRTIEDVIEKCISLNNNNN